MPSLLSRRRTMDAQEGSTFFSLDNATAAAAAAHHHHHGLYDHETPGTRQDFVLAVIESALMTLDIQHEDEEEYTTCIHQESNILPQ